MSIADDSAHISDQHCCTHPFRQLLRGVTVKRASSGEEIDLLSAWDPAPGKKTIVAFFTHTADFNSW